MKPFLFTCCWLFWDYAQALQCNAGALFTSPLLSMDNLAATQCAETDTMCLRGEGTVQATYTVPGPVGVEQTIIGE